jgi:hypothetical protein
MSTNDQNVQSPPRHTVTLGSSRSSAVNYGVIEFLRFHPIWRAVAAVLGIAFVVVAFGLWVIGYSGIKIPPIAFPLFIFVAPWFLWVATVSGRDFQLVFPVAQASKERQIAEKEFDESNSPEDALNLDLKRLNEYYVINQAQAKSSFRCVRCRASKLFLPARYRKVCLPNYTSLAGRVPLSLGSPCDPGPLIKDGG